MHWKLVLNGAIAAAALVVAAGGGYGTSAYGTSTSPSSNGRYPGVASSPTGTPAPSLMGSVALRTTPLGQILVDGSGRTLYLFEVDRSNMSSCYGDCASVWPPLIAPGTPGAGGGINQSLLATTTRKAGSLEITYNGHPPYYLVSCNKACGLTGTGV